uniref:Uncharacterized protein n=1 Tax=Anas platyrhynchos platyrhynchos TaxID=8840 RepID=A0A493SXD6_ANAPP
MLKLCKNACNCPSDCRQLSLTRHKQWYHGVLGHEVSVTNLQPFSSFQGPNQTPAHASCLSVLGNCSCSRQQ